MPMLQVCSSCVCLSSTGREEKGEQELPVRGLWCWGCRMAHQWLQSPNYVSLMSTHTVIGGSSGAKRRSRLF